MLRLSIVVVATARVTDEKCHVTQSLYIWQVAICLTSLNAGGVAVSVTVNDVSCMYEATAFSPNPHLSTGGSE